MTKPKKQKVSPYEDGDSAHWVAEKPKKKRVTPSDANSSVKYNGKVKTQRKKIITKK